MNLKMPVLKAALESAGFTAVKTLLSSGNAVFQAARTTESAVERKAEIAIEKHVGKSFLAIVRPIDALSDLLESDPFAPYRLGPNSKRVVTFARIMPSSLPTLPIERDGARILCVRDRELFSAYVPGPKGPVFMPLIEKAFGKDITTRTWDTVTKVVRAGRA